MAKRQKPHELQKAVRSWVRSLIDGSKPLDPPVSGPTRWTESGYRDRLAAQLGGKTEVAVPGGRIDILTPTEVIEVKRVPQWKAALGQVLVYGGAYRDRRLRIHLIGELTQSKLALIQQECQRHQVRVTWEPLRST